MPIALPRALACAALVAATVAGCAVPGQWAATPAARGALEAAARAEGRTLFAIYSIGGDLEDDVDEDGKPDEEQTGRPQPKGANSDDLKEIVAGLRAMTPERRARVDVLVVMGGARKQGWRGMRALDGDALVRDAQDGYLGNLPDAEYLAKDPRASMVAPTTLRRFFDLVRERAKGAGQVYVELAGHGSSYLGMGADTTLPEADQWMTLPSIGRAMADAQVKGDVLAIPACLMASLEVARAVGPRFRYLVASEETMPGEGWNYATVFGRLGQKPAVAPRDVAVTYADSLMDDPAHQYTDYKTCSVIDLARTGAALEALDGWAAAVDPADPAVRAAVVETSRTRKGFGLDAPTDPAISVDVVDYFGALARKAPALRAASSRVAAAAKAAVVHHRGDKGYEHALGVSIFPPHVRAEVGEDANYEAATAASAGYWRVIEGLRRFLPAGPQRLRPKRRHRTGPSARP